MSSKIIFITGPTNSGKSTVKNYLLDNIENLQPLLLHTNRPKRESDIEGIDYIFETTNESIKNIEKFNTIFEATNYISSHGIWYYYTSIDSIKDDSIYVIAASVDTMCRYYKYLYKLPFSVSIIPIYIKSSMYTMISRYKERSQTSDDPEILRRIRNDNLKYTRGRYYDILELILPEQNIFENNDETDIDSLLSSISNRIKELI